MLDKKYLYSALAGAAVIGSVGAAALSFAATTGSTGSLQAGTQGVQPIHQPGVGGTVTAVSGNTITVTDMDGKTYTIDASGAAITKDETVNVSDIKVGDTIGARGTVNGQSVTATDIHDGKIPPMGMGMHGRGMMGHRPNDNDADDAPGTSANTSTTQTQ